MISNTTTSGNGSSVAVSTIVSVVCTSSYQHLQGLANKPGATATERKQLITEALHKLRNQFIKLLVLVKWANNVDNNLKKCWDILDFVEKQDSYFRETADNLYYVHGRLQTAKYISTTQCLLTLFLLELLFMTFQHLLMCLPLAIIKGFHRLLLYVCHLSWLTTNVELYPSKPTE
jgi:hypothetical protein